MVFVFPPVLVIFYCFLFGKCAGLVFDFVKGRGNKQASDGMMLQLKIIIKHTHIMEQYNPLDDIFSTTTSKTPWLVRVNKIAFFIEAGLWILLFFTAILKGASWEGASAVLVLITSILSMFYLFLPTFFMGSRGVLQHLAGYAAGIPVAMCVSGLIFQIESWPGKVEMSMIGFVSALITFAVAVVLTAAIRTPPPFGHFRWHALARLVLAMLITIGGFLEGMGII